MTAVEQYNALDGQTVSRESLQEIAYLGDIQGQTNISHKLLALLEENDNEAFKIEIAEFALDQVPQDSLKGLDFAMPIDDVEGLGKAVAPDDIYQMITDKMLKQLKKASGKEYKKKWRDQNDKGYLLPFNFETKKMYRGINIPLLTEGMSKVLKNPFFLTFNQIEKNKGKLKKGSKGSPVVYFTMLYAVSEMGKDGNKIEFGTYNKNKFLSWLEKNHSKLRFNKEYYKNSYIPILKYYNVFNGADIEGINFDLDNFKIGYQDGSETIKNNDPRVEIADLIIKKYPAPQPKLLDTKKGGAYYSHNITGSIDEVHMPKFEDFETGLDYYRTLMHEFTHSTGIKKRLDRDMSGKFGSKSYAKEELVAEFGAIFLSAHAGIIWHNQKNHAEYLKNWNSVLTHAKEDNRFFMRAASKAQEATDFMLNLDSDGVPAYQNSLKIGVNKKQALDTKKPLRKEKKKPNTKLVKPTNRKRKIPAKVGEQLGLFGSQDQIKISTHKFNEFSTPELRAFILEYYNSFLKNKKLAIKNSLREVELLNRAGRKIAKGSAVYKAKTAVIEHFEKVLKQSTYNNWGKPKSNDGPDLLGYMNFKSKVKIDGENRHVRISIEVFKDRKTLLKSYEVGKKKPHSSKESPTLSSSPNEVSKSDKKPLSKYKDTKKYNPKRDGLQSPVPKVVKTPVEAVATVPTVQASKPVQVAAVREIPKPSNPNSLAARMQRNKNREFRYYDIENIDISRFLGKVEIKEKESVGISITAPQGAGKTRFAFQLIDAFSKNYKVGHASMEEHPDSSLYTSKAEEYINPENLVNIDAPDINNMQDIHRLIERNDVIVIDSFEKLREIDKNIQVDQDFRKKYDGKLFIFIFQMTSDGKMRGGSKSQFDVDIVLFTEKFDDYRENYIYPDKNRYNDIPTSELKYNIYNRAMVSGDYTIDISDVQFEEVVDDFSNSSSQIPDGRRLIATPII